MDMMKAKSKRYIGKIYMKRVQTMQDHGACYWTKCSEEHKKEIGALSYKDNKNFLLSRESELIQRN